MAQTIVQSECEGLPAPGRRTAAGFATDAVGHDPKSGFGAQLQERCGLTQSGQQGPGERGEG